MNNHSILLTPLEHDLDLQCSSQVIQLYQIQVCTGKNTTEFSGNTAILDIYDPCYKLLSWVQCRYTQRYPCNISNLSNIWHLYKYQKYFITMICLNCYCMIQIYALLCHDGMLCADNKSIYHDIWYYIFFFSFLLV